MRGDFSKLRKQQGSSHLPEPRLPPQETTGFTCACLLLRASLCVRKNCEGFSRSKLTLLTWRHIFISIEYENNQKNTQKSYKDVLGIRVGI